MDIYGLKNDAMGAMYDTQSVLKGVEWSNYNKEVKARYVRVEKAYRKLMEICEGWAGRETPTQYLQDEIWELSDYQAKQVRWAIKELGYRLPGMHH